MCLRWRVARRVSLHPNIISGLKILQEALQRNRIRSTQMAALRRNCCKAIQTNALRSLLRNAEPRIWAQSWTWVLKCIKIWNVEYFWIGSGSQCLTVISGVMCAATSYQLPCPVPKRSAKLPKGPVWACSIGRMGGRAMAHVPAWSPCPCQISLTLWIFGQKLSYVKIRARLTHHLSHILTYPDILNARSVTVSWLIKWVLCVLQFVVPKLLLMS